MNSPDKMSERELRQEVKRLRALISDVSSTLQFLVRDGRMIDAKEIDIIHDIVREALK